MSTDVQLKPVFLIAPGSIAKRDIKRIEKLSGVGERGEWFGR